MYTQCPECKTVFEIAPADLAVAAGMVRCGECSQTFSALKSLAETPLEFDTRDAPLAAGNAVAGLPETVAPAAGARPGNVSTGDRDEETSAGDIAKPGAFAAVVAAALGVNDDGSADEEPVTDSGENTDDAAEATESAAEATESAAEATDSETEATDSETEATDSASQPDDVESAAAHAGDETATVAEDEEVDAAAAALRELTDEHDDLADDEDGGDEIVLDESYEPAGSDDDIPFDDDEDWDEQSELADESALFALPVPELHATGIVTATAVPEKLEGGEAAIDPFAQDAGESAHAVDPAPAPQAIAPAPATTPAMRVNDAVDAADARDLSDYLRAPRPGRLAAAGWIGGTVLLLLALVLQIVHQHRGDLVVHPRFGAAITSLYHAFGREVRPNWHVDDYKIVGQARLIEMPAEDAPEQATGALRFVAIIANRADRPQPPPMVRVTLRDRWGDPTGVRDFAPPEYLSDRSMVEQLLEPGQRLRVVLNLRDPGVEVEGFDFDMCLPDTDGKLRCSTEPAG